MEKKTQELVYYAITAVSIVLCLLLLGVMMMGKERKTTSISEERRFSEVEIMEENPREIIITQEDIAVKLSKMLPESFPKNSVKLKINGNGQIYGGMTLNRNDIESMVKNHLGFKEKLILRMLPDTFDAGIYYTAVFDEETAMLSFNVDGFDINGMKTDAGFIPPEIPHEIAQAVNKTLLDSGYYFTKIEITDGAVILRP